MPKFVSIVALVSVVGVLTAATNGASINGVDQTTTLNCQGGPASVNGVDNKIIITGNCKSLLVDGTGNEIRINLSSSANITVKGVENQVYWTAPKGSKPRIKIAGVDNVVLREK
jgi:hypothetical protein